jgi:hypothetical protein
MAAMSLDTDGGATGHRCGDARTLEEHVDQWAARRMRAGVPARRCVLPFLTGAPKAVRIFAPSASRVLDQCPLHQLT